MTSILSSRRGLRSILGWMAAALLLARAALPMSMMMPPGLTGLEICGANGVETILVDQNMNRVNPDAPAQDDREHCGLCTIVFGLAWAAAQTSGFAPRIVFSASRGDNSQPLQQDEFALARPRAPPRFA